MSVVVQKYGGSSVATPEKIRAVAARVARTRAQGRAVCVVVSAMGDTTDELLALARRVSDRPARRELDMLLTAGERISMALLSMALNDLGVDAISFTGSQCGIITNDAHANARIVEVRPYRVQDELERGRTVIVAGYQGVSYRKEVTTLGRGGSDTTAVALAAALGAEYCEICSDVDGVYSADPRVVPEARRLAELSYEEMQALADAGARVLNAQAVEFARAKGIAIYAKATFSDGAGTVVRSEPMVRLDAPPAPCRCTAVAGADDVVVLRLDDATTTRTSELMELLDARGVSARQMFLDGGRLALVVSKENAHHLDAAADEIASRFGRLAVLDTGTGSAACVGAGMNATGANLRRALEALSREGIEVRGVAAGADRVDFLVPRDRVARAQQVLHAELIERAQAPA